MISPEFAYHEDLDLLITRVSATVLHVHDEMQFVVHKNKVDEFKAIANQLFNKTKEFFNFKCELAGEIKVGTNWSETH